MAAPAAPARAVPSARRPAPRGRRGGLLAAVLVLAVAAGCSQPGSPVADLGAAQTVLELQDALAAIREEQALLQDDLDSLRTTVARQDSLLRRLQAATGVP